MGGGYLKGEFFMTMWKEENMLLRESEENKYRPNFGSSIYKGHYPRSIVLTGRDIMEAYNEVNKENMEKDKKEFPNLCDIFDKLLKSTSDNGFGYYEEYLKPFAIEHNKDIKDVLCSVFSTIWYELNKSDEYHRPRYKFSLRLNNKIPYLNMTVKEYKNYEMENIEKIQKAFYF